jgi:membrane fusion protein, multidrug efflux system
MRITALVLVCACACRRDAGESAREEPAPIAVRCVPVHRESVEATETLRGRVAAPPGGDLPVAAQVPGRVLQVTVREGERVAPGAVVAVIDGSASRDAVRQADASLVQAKAALANADATLDRTKQLVARGIAAKQELDDATARADQARAAVSAAAAAADLARRTLGRVQVQSSFAGLVTRIWRGAGALVDGTAATPIVQLAASDLAEFDADATERELIAVSPGQTAKVTLTEGAPVPGTVIARSTSLDPATGLGVVRIALTPDNTSPATILGGFGTATIALGTRPGVLVAPAAAIRGAVADGAEVAVCAGGRAEIRAIGVGWRDDDRFEVTRGLAEGDRVAIDHVLGLQADSPIVEEK